MNRELHHNNLALRTRRGFTWVELLVVAVVIAIFAAIVAPQFGTTTDESKVAAIRAGHPVVTPATRPLPGNGPSSTETCRASAADLNLLDQGRDPAQCTAHSVHIDRWQDLSGKGDRLLDSAHICRQMPSRQIRSRVAGRSVFPTSAHWT